jgi:Fur family ferric uptake transcriptional regulator
MGWMINEMPSHQKRAAREAHPCEPGVGDPRRIEQARRSETTQLVRFLRDRGLRLTGERLRLLEAIYDQHGHIDADQLHATMSAEGAKISRATVYRNLDLLAECGLVRKHRIGRRYVYEHVHAGLDHDHLVCMDCGRIVEFVSPGISALQGEICRAHGFVPRPHQLQILAHCLDCSAPRTAGR